MTLNTVEKVKQDNSASHDSKEKQKSKDGE